jgi:hypothetical protein
MRAAPVLAAVTLVSSAAPAVAFDLPKLPEFKGPTDVQRCDANTG